MYTSCTTEPVKEEILRSFFKYEGTLRIVVGTVAFNMGLDCPNIHTIIDWGLSLDIAQYLQGAGRPGRDKEPAVACLYVTDIRCHPRDISIKEYYINKTVCRHEPV